MDSQHAAGQGDAKAHSKSHRAPYGRPQAPMGGRLGLWVSLRFRLTLAGRALRIHAVFSELVLRPELMLSNPVMSCLAACFAEVLRRFAESRTYA